MKPAARLLIAGLAFAGAAAPTIASAATIVGAARQAGNFTMLLAAGKAAGVDKALDGRGPFTIFAPDDAAFAKLPKARLDLLMRPANREMLKTTLGAHLLTGNLTMQAIDRGIAANGAVAATTVNGMPLVFKREAGALTVNGARILKAPMKVDNGWVYVIDTVLVPAMPIQPTY